MSDVTRLERPASCPKQGAVPAFDAGWNAYEVGLERDSVEMLAADKGWALLGYDAAASVSPSPETNEQ